MRCFLALEMDGPAKNALASLQAELRLLELDATYPRPEQLHATLCFFGELAQGEIDEKMRKLERFSFPSFDADVAGIFFFPAPSFVRVVWAGFGQGKAQAVELQRALAALLSHKENEPFEPHVTLARIRTPKNREKLHAFAARHADFSVPFRAERITLYQSQLSSKGPRYEPLFSKTLG